MEQITDLSGLLDLFRDHVAYRALLARLVPSGDSPSP
jgi:hypothetical protein